MKANVFISLSCFLLMVLFAYTAITKLSGLNTFSAVLSKAPLTGQYAAVIAVAIPAVELVIVGLLFFEATRRAGLFSSLILLLVFTAYLVYMVSFYPKLPCSCGGVIQKMSWKEHIVFNTAFILLTAGALWCYAKQKKGKPSDVPP